MTTFTLLDVFWFAFVGGVSGTAVTLVVAVILNWLTSR